VRHFLIDTDTASDDAVALAMALRYPDVRVEAITVVAGNVPVDQGVQNALYTVALCERQVPVYRGMAKPLLRRLETALDVHGVDGMGDIGLPLAGRTPANGHAVDALIETVDRFAGQITLVTLGPLTNVAMALVQDPAIAAKVDACVMMGGIGQGYGNVTPLAEYNVWADPEAARIVFESGLPLTMVGWDISRVYAVFDPQEAARLRAVGTPLARFCVDVQKVVNQFARRVTHLAGFDLPDAIAMAIALDPMVAVRTKHAFVTVETGGTWGRGQTVVDHLGITEREPNANVVLEASRERFLGLLYGTVRH
jgi:purine nucleosidase